jgi:transposase
MIAPSVQALAELSTRIAVLEREINVVARTKYPQTLWLQQVPGVGALTALYFVLKIEDPQRFENVRDVGAYVGETRVGTVIRLSASEPQVCNLLRF